MQDIRLTVMGFNYRGYGRSEGSPSERGVLDDARAARKWLAAKAGVPEDRIVLMGRSLGGAVAVDLAQDGCRALAVESTFTTLPDVAARIYPCLPIRWVMRTDSIRSRRSPTIGAALRQPRRRRRTRALFDGPIADRSRTEHAEAAVHHSGRRPQRPAARSLLPRPSSVSRRRPIALNRGGSACGGRLGRRHDRHAGGVFRQRRQPVGRVGFVEVNLIEFRTVGVEAEQ